MTFQSIRLAAFVLVAFLGARGVFGQADIPVQPQAVTPEIEADARAALAERFYDIGLSFAHATTASKATLKQSEILLHAAVTMDSFEPRYLRMLAQTAEAEGDADLAIQTWKTYLRLPDHAEDQVAQVELIELYLGQMQSAEEKIEYLKKLLANPKLHNVVKARLAVAAATLLDQRARPAAQEMLAEARKYYPLPEVTLLEWQMLPPDATVEKRYEALLNILRANPMNTDALAKAADILSSVGLSEDALYWYAILMDVHAAQQTGPAAQSIVNYIAERYRAGETTVAADTLEKMLSADPNDADYWFLRLTVQRADESADILKQGQQTFLRRLNIICERIVPDQAGVAVQLPVTLPAPATAPAESRVATLPATQSATQPATQQGPAEAASLPSIVAAKIPLAMAIKRVLQENDAELTNALTGALGDLAWFEVYFDHKPDAANPWIDALKELLPADNIALKRLQGWQDLASGKNAAARAIFTTQQETDDLSALGLFVLEDKENHPREQEALGVKILSKSHTGVLGALLWQATKGRGYKALPPPDQAAIQAQLAKFPKEWLEVVHAPSKAYVLRADPVKVGHRLGEPLLATITLQNVSKLDLTIGAFGLLRPVLVFDGQIRGVNARNFPGIAVDRIMGRFVLSPGEVISQVIRLDEGELSDVLKSRPGVMLLVNAAVVTNARQSPDSVVALAGGYARNFSKMFTRSAAPLGRDAARRNLIKQITTGAPSERLLAMDLLAAYIQQYSVPTANIAEKSSAQQYADVIDKACSDPTPGSKLWASYIEALLFVGPDEQKVVDAMLLSNSWESRLLGLHAARLLPRDYQKGVYTRFAATDKDLLVKEFAAAALELLPAASDLPAGPQPAATQPAATQPAATQPQTQPADASQPPTTAPTPPAVFAKPTTRPSVEP